MSGCDVLLAGIEYVFVVKVVAGAGSVFEQVPAHVMVPPHVPQGLPRSAGSVFEQVLSHWTVPPQAPQLAPTFAGPGFEQVPSHWISPLQPHTLPAVPVAMQLEEM